MDAGLDRLHVSRKYITIELHQQWVTKVKSYSDENPKYLGSISYILLCGRANGTYMLHSYNIDDVSFAYVRSANILNAESRVIQCN